MSPAPAAPSTIVAALEARLVRALDLRPWAIEPALARATSGGEEAVVLEARVHGRRGGPWLRIVTMRGPGGLDIGNVLCVGRPGSGLPLLGLDLVQLPGRRPALLVADLSPERPDVRPTAAPQSARDALLRARRTLPTATSAGPLPAWAAPYFSPEALFLRLPDGWSQVGSTGEILVDALAAHPSHSVRAVDPGAAAHQAAYMRAHREDDTALRVLHHRFGASWAGRFLDEVMFPDPSRLQAVFDG